MALTGLVLAVGFVVLAYYQSPPRSAPYDGCSDCGNYLERFWEPQFTVLVGVIGYVLWLLGVGADMGASAAVEAAHPVFRARTTPSVPIRKLHAVGLVALAALVASAVVFGILRSVPSEGPTKARNNPSATSGNYGSNFKALSSAVGFAVPEATSLHGYPLLGSWRQTHGPGNEPSGPVASIQFGSKRYESSVVSIDIARRSTPGSWGTIYAEMYAEKRFRHFPATPSCPAYTLVSGDAVTPYRAAWMGVHADLNLQRQGWCRLLRTIEGRG
jgi:hypothetical protein